MQNFEHLGKGDVVRDPDGTIYFTSFNSAPIGLPATPHSKQQTALKSDLVVSVDGFVHKNRWGYRTASDPRVNSLKNELAAAELSTKMAKDSLCAMEVLTRKIALIVGWDPDGENSLDEEVLETLGGWMQTAQDGMLASARAEKECGDYAERLFTAERRLKVVSWLSGILVLLLASAFGFVALFA